MTPLSTLLLLVIPSALQGQVGPAGPAGAVGAQGPQGVPGSAGTNGYTVRAGAGAPAQSLGVNGDHYLDTQNKIWYGPKANGAWPTGFSIIGPQGIQGIQGPAGPAGTGGGGSGAANLDNGTVDGQIAVWSVSLGKYVPATGTSIVADRTPTVEINQATALSFDLHNRRNIALSALAPLTLPLAAVGTAPNQGFEMVVNNDHSAINTLTFGTGITVKQPSYGTGTGQQVKIGIGGTVPVQIYPLGSAIIAKVKGDRRVMLWSPAYLFQLGAKPPLSAVLPTIGSPVFGIDTGQRSTFFSDTGGATQAVDSALIARVNDAFATAGISFQCDDSTSRPQLIPAVANGQAALRFAQGCPTKFMYATGGGAPAVVFQTKTFTIGLSYKRATATNYAGIFTAGNGTGGNNGQGYDLLLVEGGISPQGQARLIRAGGGDVAITRLTSPAYADNQMTKVVIRCDPTNGVEIRSRSASGSFSGSGALPTTNDLFTWDWALLGAELGYNGQALPLYPFNGDLFELRFWGERATNTQFDQMQTYLDLKYGS